MGRIRLFFNVNRGDVYNNHYTLQGYAMVSILDICWSTDNLDHAIAQAGRRRFSPMRLRLNHRQDRLGFMAHCLVQYFLQVFRILFCTDAPCLFIMTRDVSDRLARQHVFAALVFGCELTSEPSFILGKNKACKL